MKDRLQQPNDPAIAQNKGFEDESKDERALRILRDLQRKKQMGKILSDKEAKLSMMI
jgi:hypothetical protein